MAGLIILSKYSSVLSRGGWGCPCCPAGKMKENGSAGSLLYMSPEVSPLL